jgi:hypothetical protein
LDHLGFADSRVDPEIAERAIKPLDMLLELEGSLVEGSGHVERGIPVLEAPVSKRHKNLAFRHDFAVEIRHSFVCPSGHIAASVGCSRSFPGASWTIRGESVD